MLIDLKEIIQKYNLNIKGVIQVGAHWAEEHQTYVELGIENIVYIEPCKDAFDVMLRRFIKEDEPTMEMTYNQVRLIKGKHSLNKILINAACGDVEKEQIMHVSHNNQGQSNSLLPPLLHINQHPEIVFTDTEKVQVVPLDILISFIKPEKENYNLLVLDTQGSEGLVLKGATAALKNIDCIYTEINTDYTYENNMLVGEMDELLSDFERVETFMPSDNWTWGDAIYISKKLL